MKLIIMRGVSGSGKSTLARMLAGNDAVIHSTDDFFMTEGKYVFDPKKIGENHKRNQEAARKSMKDGIQTVIIDNTNTQAWEMKPYVLMAEELGYDVEIRHPEQVGFDELMRRQSSRPDKSLPAEIVQKMLDRFEHDLTVADIKNS